MLDFFALLVIFIIAALAVWLLFTIANIPINIAIKKHHPQIDAITSLAWLGVFTLGLLWVVALVWAQINHSEKQQAIADKDAQT